MSSRAILPTVALTMSLAVVPAATATGSHGDAPVPVDDECGKGKVALTFDDGPQPGVTGDLLRVLDDKNAHAAFFVQGYRAKASPGLIRRIADDGHVIGNHTWNHTDLTELSERKIHSQLARTNRAIRDAGAPDPNLMRPPYGATDETVDEVVSDMDLTEVLWTIDSRNWNGGSSDAIVRRTLTAIEPGPNIVLLHDGVETSDETVRAVPEIIEGLRERGFCVAEVGPHGKLREPDRAASGL